MLLTVLREAVIGRRTSLGAAWRAALPKVPGLIGVTVVVGLLLTVIAVVGFGLAVGLGVGIGGGPPGAPSWGSSSASPCSSCSSTCRCC